MSTPKYISYSLLASIILFLLTSCSPSFTITHSQTQEPIHIKTNRINAIITVRGLVYEDRISFQDNTLYANGSKLAWETIKALEIRKTKFGDVVAFPLQMIGGAGAIIGTLAFGLSLSNDDEDTLPLTLAGLGLAGSGALIYHLGNAMRPKEKNSIQTIITSKYSSPTKFHQ